MRALVNVSLLVKLGFLDTVGEGVLDSDLEDILADGLQDFARIVLFLGVVAGELVLVGETEESLDSCLSFISA